jgi:ribosomal protein S18 acetylase RimI-like enzyme
LTKPCARICPRDPATRLRSAWAADEPFLRHLFKSVRADDFAALPADILDKLLEQQFRAQTAGHAAQFPDALSLIILHRDEAVGRLIVAVTDDRWHIVDIALLPLARNQGVGTDLVEAVARGASDAGAREVSLSVLSTNTAARRLYLRLGFAETAEFADRAYVSMAKPLNA